MDYFARVPRLPGPDEKINASGLEIHSGGVTANNLTQLARLGAKAAWLGLIGDDDAGKTILADFQKEGMDTSGIEVMKGARSSAAWIPVDEKGDRCIYMFPNVTAKISPFEVNHRFADHIRAAKHFHTEASQLPLVPVREAMQVARGAGVRVLFDFDVSPSYFAESGLGGCHEVAESLHLVDVLKPCKAAARELTGEDDYEQMARLLQTLGPKMVAITMGKDGCLIATKENAVHVPAFQVSVVDTTGAGDAFMGGLSYALLQNWDNEHAGAFANACAALCCTKIGARAMAKREQVMELIRSQNPALASTF